MKNALSKDSKLIILNHPLIIPEKRIQLGCHVKLGGRYRLRTFKARSGSLQRDTGWFPNLITNIGLNRIGTGGINTFFYVGAGTDAPDITDTSMTSILGNTSGNSGSSNGTQISVSPYYGWNIQERQFNAGVGTGTIAEVGCGWNSNPSGAIYSHALVLDDEGNPTTIVKASDEVLTVAYEHRMYMPMDDVDTTFNITGSANHDIKIRTASASTASTWNGTSVLASGMTSSGSCIGFAGEIGAITGIPSGANTSASTNLSAYVNSSLERQQNVTAAISQLNQNNRCIFMSSALGAFQTRFDPVLAKNNTQTLALGLMWSWGRATI